MKMMNRAERKLWMVFAAGAILVLAMASAGNTNATCTPAEPEPLCQQSADCDGVPPVDCEGAWACVDGGCEFICGEEPPRECESDADCGAGEFCSLQDDFCCPPGEPCLMYLPVCVGECLPIEEPGCRTNDDCAAGEVCVIDEWNDCPPPAGCEPGMDCPAVCGAPIPMEGHCEPAPQDECWSDMDCGAGMRCEMLPCDPWMGGDEPSGAPCFDEDGDGICDNGDWFVQCPGVCVPHEPPPVECWSDADCAAGEICVIDDWCGGACPEGEDCAMPMWCGAGHCEPHEPPPADCWSDSDCGAGMMCDFSQCWGEPMPMPCEAEGDYDCAAARLVACPGVCVPHEPPPAECWSDADCGAGMRCDFDNCWAYPMECLDQDGDGMCDNDADYACMGVCVPHEPPPAECWGDADCGAGMRCDFDHCWGGVPEPCWDENGDGQCDEMADPIACMGVCVPHEEPPAECWSDADCGAGMRCEFMDYCGYEPFDCMDADGDGECDRMDEPGVWYCPGVCVPHEPPPSECWSDADCPAGEECLMACAAVDCPDDANCFAPDPYCFGECVPREDPVEYCIEDSDCGAGFRCDLDMGCGWADDGSGFAPDMPCMGICVPAEPVGECSADWDCAADQRCDLDWDRCELNCAQNGTNCGACMGQCVPIKECLDDADCPGGTWCDFGEYGCGAWDCAPDDADCMPAFPCLGVCREGPVWFEA